MPSDRAAKALLVVAVAVGTIGAAGCMGQGSDAGSSDGGPPAAQPAVLPGIRVGGCEHHNLYLQVPAASARPLVPSEFDLFATGPLVQAQLSLFSCPGVALDDGTPVGPAKWLMAQLRLADVDPALAGQGITWYLVAGYTDSAALAALFAARGFVLEEAVFDLVPLPGRWSFTLEVASADGPVLTLGQASDPAVVAPQVQDHRTLSGSGGAYAWEDQAFAMDRGYVAATTAHASSGPIAQLLGGAANGLYAIPGNVRDGQLTFGRQVPGANVEVGPH